MMRLLDFSMLIEGKSGITTAVQIIQGSGFRALKLKEKQEHKLKIEMKRRKIHAFHLVVSAVDVSMGLSVLFQSFGIGPVRANTVVFSWNKNGADPHGPIKNQDYKKFLRLPCSTDAISFCWMINDWIPLCPTLNIVKPLMSGGKTMTPVA